MAWIVTRKRSDGVSSCQVRWRSGGKRNAIIQCETFSAGSTARNNERAEGFKRMVEAAGEEWPQDWVKGQGFVRPTPTLEPQAVEPTPPPPPPRPTLGEVGEEYVRQIVDCSPGQRRRYLAQLKTLESVEVRKRGSRPAQPFIRPVDQIAEADIKAWLIAWDRSLKTKANYHGLLYGVFNYAVEQGLITVNPCARTAPKRSRIRQSQPELRFLTEAELAAAARLAGANGDLVTLAVGTGLRYGEVTALWASDIDLDRHTIRVNKAWKLDGEEGEHDTPGWLRKQLDDKHQMRGHHLGNPKTPRSRRTVSVAPALAEILRRHVEGKLPDDFVFITPTGRPLHNGDFYERVWNPLMRELAKAGIAPFRFHDLRHTHVAWLVAGGAPLPHIQARLGHESITTTIDTYGHLLPAGDRLISDIVQTALSGEEVRPAALLRLGGSSKS